MSASNNKRQRKNTVAETKVTVSERIARIFQRYPVLTSLFIVGILACLIFLLTHNRRENVVDEEVVTDVQVDDSLALNILCIPTLESLPLYHAVESGLSDSLQLALGIFTETAQFDVDSIIRRTQTIDGAVLDTYRMAYYSRTKRPLAVTEAFKLCGAWQLVTCGQLRINNVETLKKRTIGASRFSTSSFFFEKVLNGSKLKLSDIYQAQINDFGIRTNMLDENQIDAAILPEPYATLALSRGHRSIWSDKLTTTYALCFRNKVMQDKRKQDQVELLRKVYNASVLDLNSHGVHAADSALIKIYRLPKEVIDTLRLPEYRPI